MNENLYSKMACAMYGHDVHPEGYKPATLATAKHGGCVQLATVLYDRARELIGDAYNAGTHGIGYSQQIMELHDAVVAAQPSPGGQGDARRNAAYDAIDRFLRANMDDVAYAVHEEHLETLFVAARQPHGDESCEDTDAELQFYREEVLNLPNILIGAGVFSVDHEGDYKAAWANIIAGIERLAARQPVGEPVGVAYGQISLPPVPHGQVMPPDDRTGLYPVAHDDEAMREYAREAVEADREQLAAGVTHIKGAVLIDGAVHLIQKGEEMEWVHGHVDGRKATLIYAAPPAQQPAQAVDLGQFRALVEDLMASDRFDDYSPEMTSVARSAARRLLALIDGKA